MTTITTEVRVDDTAPTSPPPRASLLARLAVGLSLLNSLDQLSGRAFSTWVLQLLS